MALETLAEFVANPMEYIAADATKPLDGLHRSYLSLVADLPQELCKGFFEQARRLSVDVPLFKHLYTLATDKRTAPLVGDYFKYIRAQKSDRARAIELLTPEDVPRAAYIRDELRNLLGAAEFRQGVPIAKQLDALTLPQDEYDLLMAGYPFLPSEVKAPIKAIVKKYGPDAREILMDTFDRLRELPEDKRESYAHRILKRDWAVFARANPKIEDLYQTLRLAVVYVQGNGH